MCLSAGRIHTTLPCTVVVCKSKKKRKEKIMDAIWYVAGALALVVLYLIICGDIKW